MMGAIHDISLYIHYHAYYTLLGKVESIVSLSPYVKGFSHSPTLAKNSWLSPMMTDFSITPTSCTDKNIDNEGILAKWWVPFTIFHCIFIIMLIILCLGKWRVLYPYRPTPEPQKKQNKKKQFHTTPAQCMNHLKTTFFLTNQKIELFFV